MSRSNWEIRQLDQKYTRCALPKRPLVVDHYHPREQDVDIMAHLGETDMQELKYSMWDGAFTPYNEDFSVLWRWWFLMPNTATRIAFSLGEYVALGHTDLAISNLPDLMEATKCQE